MALNKFYSHRDNPCEVYELVEMKASTACFTHKPFFKEAITKEVQHEDLKNWRKWSKDVPALILQKTVVALQPTKSNHFSVEEAKLQVQFGLHQCYKEPLPLALRMLCFWPNKKLVTRMRAQQVLSCFFSWPLALNPGMVTSTFACPTQGRSLPTPASRSMS